MALPGETNIQNPEQRSSPERRLPDQPTEGRRVEFEPAIEQRPEQAADRQTEQFSAAETSVPTRPAVAPPPLQPLNPQRQQIESILQADLLELYQSLDEPTRQRFKLVGEETATKIEVLLQSTKVQVKKIVELIKQWLKIIPHLNKHFIEQEAKIKTDRLLATKQPNNDGRGV